MPATSRFDYFRLGEQVRRGEVPPAALMAERFDNHVHPSPSWQAHLDGRASATP